MDIMGDRPKCGAWRSTGVAASSPLVCAHCI
eukprot:IDg17526t1